MLSRIAESLFWIGRYVERADGTARILEVHLERLNGADAETEAVIVRELFAHMGLPATEEPTLRTLLDTLAHDRGAEHSIAGSFGAARENARRARETVSSSLWEAVNTTWHGLSRQPRSLVGAYNYCTWVQERCAVMRGFTDTTMSQDEAWSFIRAGRFLERADMTARLLRIHESTTLNLSWVQMLRCAGGYESFLRAAHSSISDESARDFLLLDRLFPRSVMCSLLDLERDLSRLSPDRPRIGTGNLPLRLVGDMRSSLEFTDPRDLPETLTPILQSVLRTCSEVSQAITARYFAQGQLTPWVGEQS
ncbi:MAG: alpha-E domain-containing protein [Micrococcus sp.]|nr:alpha-E domain-containing protein [Micrococcus sp.]